ncbi:MAG: hypothetical protein J0H09_12460 [Burkholderiales bacterium]|nr:hypothetical protein [Burkholderiales bacterium]ODU67478.1 MAG: hypothetical protein ABT05_03670 [Lautropia sp. SCN 66-9]
MGLFRRKGPLVFEPYSYRRRRSWSVPRWLLWLLSGIAIGAGGLYYVQQEYLPPRLSTEDSVRLQGSVSALEQRTAQLQAALDKAEADGKAVRGETARLHTELDAARQAVARLEKDLALFDEVLPPDPRDSPIGVRAAKFANDAGQLGYHVLLTRERKGGKAFRGQLEFVVAGERGGREQTVTLNPVELSFADYQHVKGSLPLPAGFLARQVTVRVLDRAGGTQQGMRVINAR